MNEHFEIEKFLKQYNNCETLDTSKSHSAADDHAKILEILNTTGNFISYLTTAIVSGQDLSFSIQLLFDCYKILRRVCATSSSFQNHCINLPNILNNVQTLLCSSTEQKLHLNNPSTRHMWTKLTTTTWEFLANSIVCNENTQRIVWFHCKTMLCNNLKTNDICRMIIYNIMRGFYIPTAEVIEIVNLLLECLNQEISIRTEQQLPAYLQLFLEYFVVQYKEINAIWTELIDGRKRLFLFFVADHLKQESPLIIGISREFLQLIVNEFKQKSDCILKTVSNYVDGIQPKTVIALLDVLTAASCNSDCMILLSQDASLFLNVTCLLQAIHHCGKKSENIFTPMNKLDQLAPNSRSYANIECEISYDIKSKLMQLIGNLAIKNRKNQDLAREMGIINVIMDCTCLDARNPLLNQWSLLAIRNLCESNAENQYIIANLVKIGDATNSDILKEININFGSMRIGGGDEFKPNVPPRRH